MVRDQETAVKIGFLGSPTVPSLQAAPVLTSANFSYSSVIGCPADRPQLIGNRMLHYLGSVGESAELQIQNAGLSALRRAAGGTVILPEDAALVKINGPPYWTTAVGFVCHRGKCGRNVGPWVYTVGD